MRYLLALFILASLVGCGDDEISRLEQLDDNIVNPPAPNNNNNNNPNGGDYSCDPFKEGQGNLDEKQGLSANVRVALTGDRDHLKYYLAEDYSLELDVTFYLNQINVPQRAFTEGFPLQDGSILQDPRTGEDLVEWFNINFYANLQLPETHKQGYYQMATLSDDGVRLMVADKALITNPGIHPPTLDCSDDVLKLAHGHKHELILNYFQGPRNHIANVLLWRRVGPNNVKPLTTRKKYFEQVAFPNKKMNSALCGKKWLTIDELIADGWEVVPASAFSMPGDTKNPCNKLEQVEVQGEASEVSL